MDFFENVFHVAVFTVGCFLFLELTRRPGKKVEGEPAIYRIGPGLRGLLGMLTVLLFIAATKFSSDPEYQGEPQAFVAATVFLIVSVLYLYAIYYYRLTITLDGVGTRRWLLSYQYVRWQDVQKIYYSGVNKSLVIVDKDRQRVRIDRYIDGTDALKAQIPAELVQRFGGEIDKL